MHFDLSRLRRGAVDPSRVDGRGQTFFVGQSPRVSELLFALPMVKAEGLAVGATGDLGVLIKRAPAAVPTPSWYGESTTLASVPALAGSEVTIELPRVGLQLEKLVIDDRSTPEGTAHREGYWKVLTAAAFVLREIDDALAQGTGSETTGPRIVGLQQLSANSGRTEATSGNLEQDVRRALERVFPTGRGPGEGPHCLIGNGNMLRRLMATATGLTGISGWKHDPVSGLFVYQYLGVPFYRTNVEITGTPPNDVTRLYAANLGPTGLNLVHTDGTPDSFGLTTDVVSAPASRAVHDVVVHGAYALALWEDEALYEISGIPASTGL